VTAFADIAHADLPDSLVPFNDNGPRNATRF